MPNGEYAASAYVHLGPEGSIRIMATAPRAVAAKAMAHAQAFASKYMRPGSPPPPFVAPPPAPMPGPPLPPIMPPTLAIPPGIMPPPSTPAPTSAMAHARSLLHQAATSQPLAMETARLARRFVPMLRPLSGATRAAVVTTRGTADLAQLCERAVMLLEAAERDPEARERLAEAVRRARRDGRLLRVLQAVRAAERRDGPDGVDALKRLAGAASLLSRADGGDREALERLQRVIGGALTAQDTEPSAVRAAGYLSVADTELVAPAAASTARPEVGAADGVVDDDPTLLELVRALRGIRAGHRRRAAR